MTATSPAISESTILARVMTAGQSSLSPELAQELLTWGFALSDHERMADLAAKARAGLLTEEEQMETEGYERVSSFLGLVKSKARRSLHQAMRVQN